MRDAPQERPNLAARLVGQGGRGARAVAQVTGIDEAANRATEEAIVRALESAAVQRALARVLERAVAEDAVERLLESEALERALFDALESELVDRVWERVLQSDEIQQLVERIAEAPEVRAAITMQGIGLIEDLGRQIGRVAARLDYVAERAARAIFGRPRRTEVTRDAGLVSRGIALLVDLGLINVALVATAALISLIASSVFGAADGASAGVVVLGVAAWSLAIGGYLVFFWTLAGQTPGMRLLGIRLDRGDGGRRLGFRQAIRRLLGLGLAILPLGLGLAAVALSDRRQGWHDRIAGTEVIRDERRMPSPWRENAEDVEADLKAALEPPGADSSDSSRS